MLTVVSKVEGVAGLPTCGSNRHVGLPERLEVRKSHRNLFLIHFTFYHYYLETVYRTSPNA